MLKAVEIHSIEITLLSTLFFDVLVPRDEVAIMLISRVELNCVFLDLKVDVFLWRNAALLKVFFNGFLHPVKKIFFKGFCPK